MLLPIEHLPWLGLHLGWEGTYKFEGEQKKIDISPWQMWEQSIPNL